MADHLTKDKRSWNMSRIRSRHTKPELIIRSLLHRAGFRFRINYRKLPGSPDIVLPKYRTVVFVHGCFWHRHQNCSRATTPGTNEEYWQKKFERNIARDNKKGDELERLNWRVIVVWECEILKDPVSVSESIIEQMRNNAHRNKALKISRKQIIKIADKKSSCYLDRENRPHDR